MVRYKVDKKGCWIWLGFVDRNGYGHVSVRHSEWLVHRLAYHLFVGPIPHDYQVHHRCLNRTCFNPEHLEATPAEDHRRLHPHFHDRPATCKHGHPFDEANTYYRKVGGDRVVRQCRKCKAILERDRQRRRRAEKLQLDASLLDAAKTTARQRGRKQSPAR